MNKKIKKLIEEHNAKIREEANTLNQYRDALGDQIIFNESFVFENLWSMRASHFDMPEKEIKKELTLMEGASKKSLDEIIKILEGIKQAISQSLPLFTKIVSNFRRGFYTLTDFCSGEKTYIYIEMLSGASEESATLYGIVSNKTVQEEIVITNKTFKIEPMDKHDFVNHYLCDRIIFCGISNENELDKYADELKEKFNNWHDSIGRWIR